VQALEDTSLDNDQLKKGRRFANSGQVGTITVSAGRIAATVHAPEDTYEAVVVVDRLSADQWTRFLDQVGSRAGHIAALLDGEMPHDLIEAAADAAVPLLPGIGDLDPSCTCDAWELPCQHAAALCYQVGWLLDEDPFVLLLMRGRSRENLLDDLQQRATTTGASATAQSTAPDGPAGVPAAEAFSTEPTALQGPTALPRPSAWPEPPELPAKVELDELAITGQQPPAGMEPASLALLVLDAARRARAQLRALLTNSADPWILDEWQDAVRLASDYPILAERLGTALGRPAELAVGVTAWTYGGAPGLDVLDHQWDPDPSEIARARTELMAAWDDQDLTLEISGNRLTSADRQLRLDRTGRWHPYSLVDNTWLPTGPADRDPTAVLATLDNG
jgi:uncharacterized Zn finger protein